MTQQEREQKMFDLGFERLENQVKTANEKGYATSSALMASRAFAEIERLADRIQKHIDERKAERGNERPRSQGDACLEALVDAYTRLPVDGRSNIDQPRLGLMLISAVVWKTLVDHAFKQNTQDDDKPTKMTRFVLKTEINRMLYLQHRIRHYNHVASMLGKSDMSQIDREKLQQLIWQANNTTLDYNTPLDRRLKRATNLYNELDRGVIYTRRGRKSKGVVLYLPHTYNHQEHYPEWKDLFKEYAGNELLNLMVVPKNELVGDDDQRPFQLETNIHTTSGDLLTPRTCYLAQLETMKDQLKTCVLDFLPTIEPPKPWQYMPTSGKENHSGGYYTDAVRKLAPLVRFGVGKCETVPSQITLDLLNKAQSVAWRVDPDQLALILKIGTTWDKTYDGIGRPMPFTEDDIKFSTGVCAVHPDILFRNENARRYKELVRKAKPGGVPLTDSELDFMDEYERVKKRISTMYYQAHNADQAVKNWRALMERFNRIKAETFYFVWSCDYRTRVYPKSGLGHPQGGSPERYTLVFANGERLTPEGEKAALRAIGTAYMDSKKSISDRIQWSRDNLDLIREVAEHTPRSITLAEEADEPLMFLMLCRQWVRHEAGEPWTAPVYADATNSGWCIAAAILNNIKGLVATNITPSTEDDAPNDAYRIVLDQVINWILDDDIKVGGRKIKQEQRNDAIEVLTDDNGKLGRKCSKAYGRTAIYGSGLAVQIRDIRKEMTAKGIKLDKINKEMCTMITKQFERGYRQELGDILQFNKLVGEMAKNYFFSEVNDEGETVVIEPDDPVRERWQELTRRRNKKKEKGNELSQKDMAEYIDVSRTLTDRTKHGVKFTSTDGTIVDCTQYLKTNELLQTQFHGRPTAPVTHDDALDIQGMIQSVAPAVIHSMDAHILKLAYSQVPYDISLVHDSAGCHPNNFDDMCERYRNAFLEVTSKPVLKNLAKELGGSQADVDELMGTDTSWRDDVQHSTNMFN